jgi:alkylation response protein AidB-like acyl-CoA dehydrogenase
MSLTAQQIAEQQKQAEELLFSGPQAIGFAKGLYFGQFFAPLLFPYPELKPEERDTVNQSLVEIRRFVEEHIDPAAIDRNADIPQDVVEGLGRLGVLGMTVPKELGGRGFSQLAYCKVMEIVGGRCPATGIFVNAHQSIGVRGLALFGTPEQQKRWLPRLMTGEELAAFALTEPEAGSDAANVQTTATPTPDGKGYILSGQKRYITNGGIAKVLTVMARTPVPPTNESKITAFVVTNDMPGFKVLEARMPKCGIRGTATARLAFENMFVPKENILGQLGKGLKIALTVLDFGRTTFGASCTGVAKICIRDSIDYANSRTQFKQTLGEFELVKKKIAFMTSHTFAMEAMTDQCAAFIDRGAEDYMLETAMLKVFSTEALWVIVNDTLQIFGGAGYFTDKPYERMMRDARINQIGEGANDVLKSFIALVGMRGVGEELKSVLDAVKNPFKGSGRLWKFVRGQVGARFSVPVPPVQNPILQQDAAEIGKRVRDFGLAVQGLLRRYREGILERQYIHERISDVACDLYASACTLSRLNHLMGQGNGSTEAQPDVAAGRYFLRYADRRMRQNLAALHENDDELTTHTANVWLGKCVKG